MVEHRQRTPTQEVGQAMITHRTTCRILTPFRFAMARWSARVGVIVAATMIACSGQDAQAQLSAERVQGAIDRGVDYLLRRQYPKGNWPDGKYGQQYPGAMTSLCTLALLNAGLEPADPRIQRALDQIRQSRPKKTYSLALQTMALCAAKQKRDILTIRDNVRWLEKNQLKIDSSRGSWAYPEGPGDASNSQFAVLALYEAKRVGVRVSDLTWRQALGHWSRWQNPNGSWGYQRGHQGTGSMTCAGIASMVIITDQLRSADAVIENGRVRCCAATEEESAVDRGLAWLGRNFQVRGNPGARRYRLYYLYALERVGRMTAHRFIGERDWYREGTQVLLDSQEPLSGFWRGDGPGDEDSNVGTAFALLFLSKGRRPVLMAKLKRPDTDDWNRHRSDVHNLTRYVESRWERDLTWHVLDVERATLDDMAQSPVLFLNGRDRPVFNDEQIEMLRAYVDQGGFIFAESCCEGAEFDAGFRDLMGRVFPEPEYRLKLLEPNHPIWRAEEPVDPEHVKALYGIDVGCRTSVVYCDEDLSCYWELARAVPGRTIDADIAVDITNANAIGINVLAYATNRDLKYKDEVPQFVERATAEDRVERAKLHIAKLRHTGGWGEAPNALINLQAALGREVGVRVGSERRELALTDEALFDYPLAFMDGRRSFRFSDAEREQLREYIQRGASLIVNSICASGEFTRAVQNELATVFPDAPLVQVPSDHPMFNTDFGGYDIRSVTRRDPRRGGNNRPLESQRIKVAPEIYGVEIDGRYGVLFSPYDLSCALELHESLECQGYTREDAARIGINLILYSIHQ